MPWVKGQSGNKSGRPKLYPEVQELARKHTAANIEKLAFWRDQDLDPGASVRAAQYLHEIAWGKPSQAVAITGDLIHKADDSVVSLLAEIRNLRGD